MRLLVYGLQNSGATLVTLYVGQRADCVVIPDLWTMFRAPEYPFWHDSCVKATITTSFPLESHLASYRPDRTILVLRRPVDNYLSLRSKPFANHNGLLHEKFMYANHIFEDRARFDHVVVFEDFGTKHNVLATELAHAGWAMPDAAATFPRSTLDMEQFNLDREPDLYRFAQWGTGQARVEHLDMLRLKHSRDTEAALFCERHCPALHDFYDGPHPGWTPPAGGFEIGCDVGTTASIGQTVAVNNFIALAESRLREGDPHGAVEITAPLCNSGYCSPAAWDVHARALEATEQANEVEPLLRRLLADSAAIDKGVMRRLLAQHAMRTGRLEEAAILAVEAIADGHDTLATRLLLAQVNLKLGDFNASHNHALQALELNPRHVYARRVLAQALIGLERVDEARSQLEACLRIDPSSAGALRLLEQIQKERTSQNSP